jgi:hypothetical protein
MAALLISNLTASKTEIDEKTERCKGVLLGLASGDRNGGPIRMALRLAESLLENGSYNRKDVITRYHNWYKGKFRNWWKKLISIRATF